MPQCGAAVAGTRHARLRWPPHDGAPLGRTTAQKRTTSLSGAQADADQVPSARQITRLLMRDDVPPAATQSLVSRVLTELPGLADCITVAKWLDQVLRRKSKESLD